MYIHLCPIIFVFFPDGPAKVGAKKKEHYTYFAMHLNHRRDVEITFFETKSTTKW